ncbi:plasmid stabilization system protein ParE [Flavobacterium sp. 2755]|nr:plasmid stabilization system protein ParE [Flavobacterium sp. 2755]
MKIVWSSRATYTFYTTRNYLTQFRSNEIAQKFVKEVLHIIDLVTINPHLGKFRHDLECNEILVTKNISLYYILNRDVIHLIEFHDNRQKPLTILNF